MSQEINGLIEKLERFAKTGRERRAKVVLNSHHAEVLDEAAAEPRRLSAQPSTEVQSRVLTFDQVVPSTEAVKLALVRLNDNLASAPAEADKCFVSLDDHRTILAALRQSPPLPSGDEVERVAQMLQDHMEQHHGLFLKASECDAFAIAALNTTKDQSDG